jgi:hypothetical protein
MYTVINEDRGVPIVGERTPPWGAADGATYVGRIRRNLSSLEKVPGLLLTYEFPGFEFEAMARDFPDVITKMQDMYQKGVFDFVNGNYSAPHLHTLSSESNWRQFEYGLEVFKKLFNKEIRLYACQETSLHQQLPQILRRFGYRMLAMPQFSWAAEISEGPFEFESSSAGTIFIRGEEFIDAQALDGSCLPAYLSQFDTDFKHAIDRDLYGPPPVWFYIPDLEEVDQKTYDEWSVMFDFMLLEKALAERVKLAPPRTKARVYSYWSYVEGVWAEELQRKNREAERTALLAESIQAMASLARSSAGMNDEIREIWRTICKYQHHDVEWIEVTHLRRKAINYLTEGMVRNRQIMEDIGKTLVDADPESIAAFNGLARPRRALIEMQSVEVPGVGAAFQLFEGRAVGVWELPAGGFRSFPVAPDSAVASKDVPLPVKLMTSHYIVTFSPSGLIEQITTAQGKDLLKPGKYLGGELRAMIHNEWVDNRSAACRFYEGDVCYILVRSSSLGGIPVLERYFLYRGENCIKAELEFNFNGNEVGYFWLDETKVNVYYPTTGSDVYHDIPFGYVAGREQRPLFPSNWLYCGGLAYVNWGTVKHWVKNGVMANVLAWGGNVFDNRRDFDDWTAQQQYDLRLHGKQTISYALIPYGQFDGNRIVHDVEELTAPVFMTKGRGERSFYEVKDRDLAVTAIYARDGQVWARGYRLPSEKESKYGSWEIFDAPITDLVGERG